jgi:hypothetical protein
MGKPLMAAESICRPYRLRDRNCGYHRLEHCVGRRKVATQRSSAKNSPTESHK